ncbi:glycosyltransferase [Rhodocytophaga rosea]|uniref:Glycosyltransferase n=1 Tax=Rhodocytophaga rosea TaxID=2704465 RepID=A0A6C0GNH3_9BACT|nr:glycosyltransferase [Rhodocytophaga rosea]QHT69585.1 glycosyltransferase [Rhodocytophaga rosea]
MKLTVSIITYNQVKFIAQAIDSVLMQQTDFDFEVLIGEDDSNDGTREIVKQYEVKYPDKIRVFYHSYPPDYKRINGRLNFVNNIKNARGKYIALLEGDDYWTSPHKLQKQVDFLEAHPDFAICFHNARYDYEDGRPSHLAITKDSKAEFVVKDLIEKNFIMTASCVFRNKLFLDFPEWYYKLAFGDWSLHILNAKYGKIGYLNEIMSVYRIHEGGLWSKNWLKQISIEKQVNNLYARIFFYICINKYLNYQYSKRIGEIVLNFHKEIVNILISNKVLNNEHIKESLNYCIIHSSFDKSLSRKIIVKTFLQVHFPFFYSVFFRLRAKFS